MGRQFQVYLLPSDVDNLIDDLKANIGVKMVLSKSSSPKPIEVNSSTASRITIANSGLHSYERCYLQPESGPSIRMHFIEKQGYWLIDTDSEAIELDGCDYGGDVLTEGRFYYQTDLLSASGDALVPKSMEFVKWAVRLFQRAKNSLIWSPESSAYIGREAFRWKNEPGHTFIDTAAEIRLFATRHRSSNKIQ